MKGVAKGGCNGGCEGCNQFFIWVKVMKRHRFYNYSVNVSQFTLKKQRFLSKWGENDEKAQVLQIFSECRWCGKGEGGGGLEGWFGGVVWERKEGCGCGERRVVLGVVVWGGDAGDGGLGERREGEGGRLRGEEG